MSQLSLMFDLERCIGCKSCEAACKPLMERNKDAVGYASCLQACGGTKPTSPAARW